VEEKQALVVDEKTYIQQLELLRFQASEITNARLLPGEDQEIEQDYLRANNSARLQQLSQSALDLLSENESSLLAQAGLIGRTLHELERVDSSAKALTLLQENVVSLLQELRTAISRYADRIELDPARLQQLEDRLNLLQSLKRKYSPSLAGVIEFGEEARQKLATLEKRDEELSRINSELKKLDAEILASGKVLSAKRRKLIPQLSKATSQQLADLGFAQSRFEISIETLDEEQAKLPVHQLSAQGLDTVEFQFAPNPGEPIRPLRAIASSGELARVMLALKTVLAAEDQVPVLVFDEVDANVGGETASAVGDKMRQIAQRRQVLCISHLPQVAAAASTHFLVSKEIRDGRTITQITRLDRKDRVTELARMLGGQSEAARNHAEALLGAQ
jgi:DNA repair protein RecN (Recombination protein N)